MTNKNNPPNLYVSRNSVDATIGAQEGFTENCIDLLSILEAIESTFDGSKPKVQNYKITIRARCSVVDAAFLLTPVIVQTAGTWTSNANADINGNSLHKAIAADIDDVFGMYIFPGKISQRKPVSTLTQTSSHCCEFTLTVPSHLLVLLNKEIETERLQEILFGIIGVGSNTQRVDIQLFQEITYTLIRKKIIFR